MYAFKLTCPTTYFLAMLFWLCHSNSNAQDFGALGSKWHFTNVLMNGGCQDCAFTSIHSVRDTMILGQKVHQLEEYYHDYPMDSHFVRSHFVFQEADTVYFYSKHEGRFQKIYVFNLKEGDTARLDNAYSSDKYTLRMDSIKSLSINGETLNEYFGSIVRGKQVTFDGHYFDRIGATDWIFPRGSIIPESGGPIRCYSDSTLDSNFQGIPCDFLYVSMREDAKRSLGLYPNPAKNRLKVEAAHKIAWLGLYSWDGRLVLESTNSDLMDLSQVSRGIYTVLVRFDTGVQQAYKLLKQ